MLLSYYIIIPPGNQWLDENILYTKFQRNIWYIFVCISLSLLVKEYHHYCYHHQHHHHHLRHTKN
jgi:hypothetical protein